MKFICSTCMLLIIIGVTFAQSKPKPRQEKPASKSEMEKMMKEAQMEIDNMDPETLRMMDSLGIKKPSFKNVPTVSDKQLADANENENRIVPKKDVLRIAAIPKTATDGNMGAYIIAIQNKAAALLKPEVKNMADKIYSYIKSKSRNSAEAGNMATGLWAGGKPEIAYFTLGKICAEDPTNTDNLSNYASMLSMLGAQHLAIPILNNLNTKFPQNSTILNNLGQAWYGLGDIAKAEKYLDSAIRLYAYHPQATYTKSFIEESMLPLTTADLLEDGPVSATVAATAPEPAITPPVAVVPAPVAPPTFVTISAAAAPTEPASVPLHEKLKAGQPVAPLLAETLRATAAPASLAERTSPKVETLREAVSINQRFSFINELFGGENMEYHAAIQHLDSLPTSDQARAYVTSDLSQRYDWSRKEEHVSKLLKLIERKFA